MLTHSQIWTAIDTLAQRHGLTPSALAKRAGLDATTFNRSKRQGADGHPRWPSTESIAKILAATGVGVDEFLAIITSEPGPSHLPFQFADHLTADAFDDEGRPQGAGWDRIEPLQGLRGDAFAIGLACDRFAPAYKQGDMIIASPSAPRRRGDRVLLLATDGSLMIGELGLETAMQVRLRGLSGEELPAHKTKDIRLLARILWLSQ
ncbi:MAG: helix-turn-helix transcriptional regulator [Methylobacterium sp.]|jgi:phage repressor protein C with HTH and peptisase S24 domain|nr:helix-turn-helix transcriptional regulator [Methylobacterium sp.]MCZ8270360.1 helix-turn-helix transcriptional regulator [Beijerinckiaceae bacterium]MCA3654447.1 helix-turn-helix transcriptional regulator [Methylobacterium sp.]MCA3657264.1 helix-turn-helix transcriptional regulator [Methylobacterium sp.]MCA3660947.1 helix-turn-helix transcriptional regulator [Methylobacterium sp.]